MLYAALLFFGEFVAYGFAFRRLKVVGADDANPFALGKSQLP
jgi:hypothetical protein